MFEMLKRDAERLQDCRKRVNRLPLVPPHWPVPATRSSAICGRTVKFDGVCENSLDAVSGS